MKKLLTLIIPVLLLMVACNNKPTGETTAVAQDTVAVVDSTVMAKDTSEVPTGGPTMPAQVFDDATGLGLAGASVLVKEAQKTIETPTTDEKGAYVCGKVVSGHTYTFTASKAGYVTMSATALYENPNSLPYFAMKK